VTIIDGGMGGEIRRRWPAAASGLWSAQALVDAPQVVVDVHRDYINAGAQLILTNSYSTVPSYLSKGGIEDRYEELTSLAGKLARQAVEESGKSVLVAGAVPPLE
jgi:S-methylmethionine-dependent homocysteine/selenocysteine methylase